jgi:hypothetical protein
LPYACLFAFWVIATRSEIGSLLFLGSFSGFISFLLYSNWTTHDGAELILTSDSIYYTGWKQPIRFRDLESVRSAMFKGNISLFFKFKGHQDNPWKISLPPRKTSGFLFPLARMRENPAIIAKTIERYFYAVDCALKQVAP